jgi:hypothetical protein
MMYQDMVSDRLSAPPIMFLQCSQPECTAHACLLDDYANHIVSTLLDCAFCCFPSKSSSSRRVHGWNDSAAKLKEASILWHRIWTETGCPSADVLSTIKKHAKKRYKYEVRRLKRRQEYRLHSRLAHSFAMSRRETFWSDIKRLNNSRTPQSSPVVDGFCGSSNIANHFASKFRHFVKQALSYLSILTSIFHSVVPDCLRSKFCGFIGRSRC